MIEARFQASHPRNDLRLNDSYAFAEQLQRDGTWKELATDRSPNLLYTWHPQVLPPVALDPAYTGASEASVSWQLPRNLEPGRYRLRTRGFAVPGGAWEGVSGVVEVAGTPARCP